MVTSTETSVSCTNSTDAMANSTGSSSSSSSTTTTSLKRKRPPMIAIPNVLQEIQVDRLQDRLPHNNAISVDGVGVGVFSLKGKKKFMEDTHKISFFGVYDGHGGKKAAEFVAKNLHNNILEMMENCMEKEEAVRAGYLRTDQDFLKQGIGSGACCVTALIDGQEVVISNLGDCRAVLSRDGVAEALTKDHRAEQEDERKRIEKKVGGYVEIHHGAWRVHGILSVSRSIGDAHLKDWVLAEPDTKILQLTSDMEFLVLASDGLWEEVGNQEAVDLVKRLCPVEKNLGSSLDCLTSNDDDHGCVNISPSSKLRRISLVKQPKGMSQSPIYKRTFNSWKDCENIFVSEDESSPSKSRRILLAKQIKTKIESPTKENGDHKKRHTSGGLMDESSGDSPNDNADNYCRVSVSPLRRILLPRGIGESPIYKTLGGWKDSENESPPLKSQRLSLVKRVNTKIESPTKENSGYRTTPASVGLVDACKELANLAVSRGSLDDITVMIIDLKHFGSKSTCGGLA
ncbi:hypothetical protein FEM48_Zijuj10G0049700 [Ziziphus jujuba var. spinosa]|uniref:protein-serine/threonine phosphatase n=1 Tax=Ziziphus jujuba var. spinosa TaxID=714518 RepID=A0A978ULF4_ZIZJJ|nr:hypothetical protein FEM48_Zijuj10G0049700 [Ziziphus jujuba var. spinosa]